MPRTLLALCIAAGALVRIAAFPLPGTTDVRYFQIWARAAASERPSSLYASPDLPGERRTLERDGVRTKVDYPPLALHVLGWAARASPDRVLYGIKAVTVLADAALACLLFLAGRRSPGAPLALWLNPASVLIGSVLGYLDPWFALPAVAALVAAASGRAGAAGALAAAACLVKPLAIFALPSVAAAVWHTGDSSARRMRIVMACAGAAAIAVVVLAPVAWHGGATSLAWAMGSLLRDPFLSANGVAVWAIVEAAVPETLVDAARVAGALATLGALAWLWWHARHVRDVWGLAALAGCATLAYATLAVAVHENHAYLAIPMFALASAGRPAFRGPFVAVSAIVAMNLYFAYGFGVDVPFGPPVSVAALQPLVWLSVVNLATFAWTTSIFRREVRAI